jgi:hypothetical protein
VKEARMARKVDKCAQNVGGTLCYAEEIGTEQNSFRIVTNMGQFSDSAMGIG